MPNRLGLAAMFLLITYVPLTIWDPASTAYDHGANIVFFAASPVLRHVRTQPSPFGADRELVDYRDSAADPLDGKGNPRQVTGNEWSNPPSSWPEHSFVGDTYAGFLEPGLHVGFRVADALAWVFAGTGLRGNSGCHPGGICESAMVQRITANILRLFGQGPAARHQPSVPNWRQVTSQ